MHYRLPVAILTQLMQHASILAHAIHNTHNKRSSHALRMLLQTLRRRVLTARRSEMLLMIMHAAAVLRICIGCYSVAAHEVSYADLLRLQLCVSWPSGLLRGHLSRLPGQKWRVIRSAWSSLIPRRGM